MYFTEGVRRREPADDDVELGAEITGVRGEITEVRAETKRAIARQTFVILAAVAAAFVPLWLDMLGRAGG
ncbi:MAG: hypothetical protein OXE75_10550 [bacterium]|nr:hypothetical protein [bacterium]